MVSDDVQEDTTMTVDTVATSAEDRTLTQDVASVPPSNQVLSTDDSQERVVQSIYDHIVSSIVAGYASNIHELMKTGAVSPSELKTTVSRAALFPTLYSPSQTPKEIQETLDRYATEMPPVRQQSLPSRKRKLPPTEETTKTEKEDDTQKEDTTDVDDEDYKEEAREANGEDASTTAATASANEGTVTPPNTTEVTSATTAQTTTNNSSATVGTSTPGVDIWGRIPPKEPSLPVECTLCGRHHLYRVLVAN
eukprot:Nitzschia sp. Nitz4//scaffold46_size129759//104346//105279//NITZ4_003519-RA/size129759-snap-gene-0.30-mRNA-1//-1//CDS//3329552649//7758//frame0